MGGSPAQQALAPWEGDVGESRGRRWGKTPLSFRGEREELSISVFRAAGMILASPQGAVFRRECYPLVARAAIRWMLL